MSLYIKLDCDALSDAKLLAVGPDGFTLYVKGLMYSKQHLTDGFVPEHAIALLSIGIRNAKKLIQLLIDVDLWKKCDGGFTVGAERWAKRQTTKLQVEETRKETARRVAEFREKKRNASVTPLQNESNSDVTPPVTPLYDTIRVQSTEYRAQSTEPYNSSLLPPSAETETVLEVVVGELVDEAAVPIIPNDKTPKKATEPQWEALKEAYPRREGAQEYPAARKKLDSLIASGEDFDLILAGAGAYLAACQKAQKIGTPYVKQLSTWLNRQCWKDEILEGQAEGPKGRLARMLGT